MSADPSDPAYAARRAPAQRLSASVSGRVQGVGYRYFVMREARGLGVSGFARNLPDGTVDDNWKPPAYAIRTHTLKIVYDPTVAESTSKIVAFDLTTVAAEHPSARRWDLYVVAIVPQGATPLHDTIRETVEHDTRYARKLVVAGAVTR